MCEDNGQDPAPTTTYGIAIEPIASSTIDTLTVVCNVCQNQGRGISFGTSGTVSNVLLDGNVCKNNTVDFVAGASLQTSTLLKGWNLGTTGGASALLAWPTPLSSQYFWTDNLPQSSGTVVCTDGFGGRGYVVTKAGFLRSLTVKSNANVTAGNATFQLRVNGSINSAFNVVLNTTNPTFLRTEVNPFAQAVAAGDMITVIATGDASLLPNGTADFDAVVEIAS